MIGRVDNGENVARELRVGKRLVKGTGHGCSAGWENGETEGQILALSLTLLLWVNCYRYLGFGFVFFLPLTREGVGSLG